MVFTQIFRWLINFSVGALLVSCATYRTMSVDVLTPADFPLPQGKKVSVCDRNIQHRIYAGLFLNDYNSISRDNLFNEFAKGIQYISLDTRYVDSVYTLKEAAITWQNTDSFPAPLPGGPVSEWCRNNQVDYLICLEFAYYHITDIPDEFSTKWLVRLYSINPFEVIDSVLLTDSVGKESFTAEQEMVDRILAGAWDMGAKYARRIMPAWQKTERRIYRQGKLLSVGDAFFQKGNLEEAFNIWLGGMELNNKTTVRAAINLAWLYENAGDFEQAEEILQTTEEMTRRQKMKGEEVAWLKQYLQEIRQRKENMKVLEQQLSAVKKED